MSGSTPLLPSVWTKVAATTGVGMMKGSAATKAIAGRNPSLRLRPWISRIAAAMFSSASGAFNSAIDGRPIQKNGAAIHAWTPSM